MKTTLKILIVGFIAGFGGAYVAYDFFIKPSLEKIPTEVKYDAVKYDSPAFTSAATAPAPVVVAADPVDFSAAASMATQSVVYINSISRGASYTTWDWFFGEGTSGGRTQVSSGSGVIFSKDGYI